MIPTIALANTDLNKVYDEISYKTRYLTTKEEDSLVIFKKLHTVRKDSNVEGYVSNIIVCNNLSCKSFDFTENDSPVTKNISNTYYKFKVTLDQNHNAYGMLCINKSLICRSKLTITSIENKNNYTLPHYLESHNETIYLDVERENSF